MITTPQHPPPTTHGKGTTLPTLAVTAMLVVTALAATAALRAVSGQEPLVEVAPAATFSESGQEGLLL